METRCRICGLIDIVAHTHRSRMCYMCQGAHRRFQTDPGWGMKTIGGPQTVRGKLRFDGPLREVPNVPSGSWFRYIVRERLLRGLCRYPTTQPKRDKNQHWNPDKMPPWNDAHLVPSDGFEIPPLMGLVLGLVEAPHAQPDPRLSDIGPWQPPATGL